MGFDKLSEIPRKLLRKNDNKYVIGSFDDKSDTIIPMKVTVIDMLETIKEKACLVMRKQVKTNTSYILPKEHFEQNMGEKVKKG